MNSSQRAKPKAALVIIGAEVLSGKIADQNGPYLIRELRERGVELTEIRTIGDDIDTIADCVAQLYSVNDYLFTTGGIGPTHDDVTIEGVAQGLGQSMTRHKLLETSLRNHFGDRLNESRLKLADIPEGAYVEMVTPVLPLIRAENVFIFPGVPELMQQSFQHMAHELKGTPFISRHITVRGSESAMADHLRSVQNSNPAVQIGSYPRFLEDGCEVKITVDGRSANEVDKALEEIITGLEQERIIHQN
jgi:molybdenum cofactor synthesis domain-containing protein